MVQRHFLFSYGSAFLILAVLGCGPATPPVAETPPPPVTVSQPVVREVIEQDDYEGRIAAKETVDVQARVRGHLIKINFTDVQIVQKDELLFEIDPRPYQAALDAAKAQVAAADAALELATREYRRAASLLQSRAASRANRPCSAGRQELVKALRATSSSSAARRGASWSFLRARPTRRRQ